MVLSAVTISNGVLSVTLNDTEQDISVYSSETADQIIVEVDETVINTTAAAEVDSIAITANDLANDINISGLALQVVDATSIDAQGGNDTVEGSMSPDSIIGGDGDDLIFGGGRPDALDGGDGDDTMSGNSGNDALDGGDGDDFLRGQRGQDSAIGGAGYDVIDIDLDKIDKEDGCEVESVSEFEFAEPPGGDVNQSGSANFGDVAPSGANLDWDDFKKVAGPQNFDAKTVWEHNDSIGKRKISGTAKRKCNEICVAVVVSATKPELTVKFSNLSWVVKGKETTYLLNHERLHLKIAERIAARGTELAKQVKGSAEACDKNQAVAQKEAITKARSDFTTKWNKLIAQWIKIDKAATELYDSKGETNHSLNVAKQKDWDKNWQKKVDKVMSDHGW